MKKITVERLKEIDKRHNRESQLTVFDRIIFRPIGTYLAYFFIKFLSLNSNNVTLMSVVFAIMGCILIISEYLIFGALVLLLFPILDCADGTMARAGFKGRMNGALVDALGGYSFLVIFWSSLVLKFCIEENIFLFSLSLFTLNANLWSRLFYLKAKIEREFLNKTSTTQHTARSSYSYHIYENLEFGSALIPIFITCIYFNILNLFIIFYAIIATLLMCWVLDKIFLRDN